MKKVGLILASFCITIMMASVAQAVPLYGGDYNGIYFRNNETIIDVNNTPGVIDQGDYFIGILDAQNIDQTNSTGTVQNQEVWSGGNLSNPAEITGYFAMEVASVQLGAGPGGSDIITYQALSIPDPYGKLAPGEVFAIYEDNNNNYNSAAGIVPGITNATDGIKSWTMGMQNGGYFFTLGTAVIPQVPGLIGTTYAGMNFITGPTVMKIQDPILGGPFVDIWFNAASGILQNPVTGGPGGAPYDPTKFSVWSNDPAVLFPVPEPASMLLLGTGLVGLAGASRRRRKANKK